MTRKKQLVPAKDVAKVPGLEHRRLAAFIARDLFTSGIGHRVESLLT